jgi:hypothetical protein
MALEDEFNVEIPDKASHFSLTMQDAEEIFTPRQAVEKVLFSYSHNLDSRQQKCDVIK